MEVARSKGKNSWNGIKRGGIRDTARVLKISLSMDNRI